MCVENIKYIYGLEKKKRKKIENNNLILIIENCLITKDERFVQNP